MHSKQFWRAFVESGTSLGAGDGVAGIPVFRQLAYCNCLLWKQRAPTQTQIHIPVVLDGDSANREENSKGLGWGRAGRSQNCIRPNGAM